MIHAPVIHEMRKIVKTIGGGWQFILLLILRSPFNAVFTIVHATFLQHAFYAVEQMDKIGLTWVCLKFGVASLFLFLYNGCIWCIYATFCAHMEGKLRMEMYHRMFSFPYERIESTSQGKWLTRLNTDVEAPFSRGFHFPHGACAILNISISGIFLWKIKPEVFGLVMIFVVPHIVVNQLIVARGISGINQKSMEAKEQNTDEMLAIITCADAVHIYEGQDYLLDRFEQSSLCMWKINMKIHLRKALSAGFQPLFSLGGYLTLLAVSSRWIKKSLLVFGDLTAAFQYRGGILMGTFMLINCLISIQTSMAGIRRVNEIICEEEV